MRATQLILASVVFAMSGACARREPVTDNAERKAGNVPPPALPTAPAPPSAPPANDMAPAATPTLQPIAAIPVSLQGRWGLTPADCTSAAGDAKGLLVITPGELHFYESRAVPSPGVQADADSISGNFHFTGEGQSWTKFETLERRKEKLVRTEKKPTASFTYAKC